MTRARGSTVYIVLGALVVVAGIVLAVLGYGKAERNAGHASGVTEERSRWQKWYADETAKMSAEIVALKDQVAQREREAAETLAALAGLHAEEMAHVQAQRDAFLDDLFAGRVRIGSGFRCPAGEPSGGDGATPPATAGRGDAQAGGDFPPALQAAVAGGARLAAEADEVTLQLTLAQGVIEEYRRACR